MTSETTKARAKLTSLSSSLDELESYLEPLFSQSLAETVLPLEPLQQAKLQTVLPYLVYDLIFIYLKTRGIDPKTHGVVPELDRVRQYFQKISNAESPSSRRTVVDKAAASRMIKQGISAKTYGNNAPEAEAPSSSSTVVVPKITTKMAEREAYLKKNKEQDANSKDDEDHLEMFDDDDEEAGPSTSQKVTTDLVSSPQNTSVPSTKRKRPAVDPFAGYGDDRNPGPPTQNANDDQGAEAEMQVSADETATSSKRRNVKTDDSKKTKKKSKKGR